MRPGHFIALITAAALLLVPSCSSRSIFVPPGSYSNIVLVTETGEPGGLNDEIIRVLQHPIDYYSKLEIQFRLRMISSYDFEREPPTKNMVIFGVVREGATGQIIENFIGTNSVRKVLEGKNHVFKRMDYPVKGQLTVIVTASSPERLRKVTREKAQLIRDIIEDANRQRLRENLLLRENTETAEDLRIKYGFSLRIPDQYRLNRDWGDLPGVEILRDYPHRGITVSWMSWGKKTLSTADSTALYDFRSKIVYKIHDKEVMRPELVSWSYTKFGEHNAVRMDGYWESSVDMYGGPFICFFVHDRVRGKIWMIDALVYAPVCFFVHDRVRGKIWMIDALVYAPGFDKHILLREAVAVAETFMVN
jgi:hypothetical protein